jgi:hypothetical protein
VNGSENGQYSEYLDNSTIDKSALALRHLYLLKLAYQRLGSWPKPYAEYERLNADIFRGFGGEQQWKGAQGIEKWEAKGFGTGKAEADQGIFETVREWGFVSGEGMGENGHANGNGTHKHTQGIEPEEEL